MTIDQVKERVIEIISDGVEYDGTITPDMNLIEEIGLSSLESMVIIGELESEFGIELPIKEVKEITNIGEPFFFHNVIDSVQDKIRHCIIGFHRLINDFGQRRIIPHEKPRIYTNTVSTDTRPRLKNVHTRMHIADSNNLIYIHMIISTDFRQFICKRDVHRSICILHHLRHLSSSNICDHNFPLAK